MSQVNINVSSEYQCLVRFKHNLLNILSIKAQVLNVSGKIPMSQVNINVSGKYQCLR